MGVRIYLLACLSALFVPVMGGEKETGLHFESIKDRPLKLRHFLATMPKGGDLHSHLSGAIYAESYLAWAAEDNKCINLSNLALAPGPCDVSEDLKSVKDFYPGGPQDVDDLLVRVVDALSVRDYNLRGLSGHQQFFSTFSRFYQASAGRLGDMLAEVTSRAAQQNIGYLELMHSPGMIAASLEAGRESDITKPYGERVSHSALRLIAEKAMLEIDEMEKGRSLLQSCQISNEAKTGCRVTVRYLAQVIRTWKPEQVYAQTLLAFMLMEMDERVVGLNFVAPEDHPVSLRDYSTHMKFIQELSAEFKNSNQNIALHAGELTLGLVPPEYLGWHIRDAIEIAGAKRIGHGIDISYDPQMFTTLAKMRQSDVAVEINLTSNEVILGVSGENHPISIYLEEDVPITISTDDEGVSRIDLTNEYLRAVRTYDMDYKTVKGISRNALQYSFLDGAALFQNPKNGVLATACSAGLPEDLSEASPCAAFISDNEKATKQWELEKSFDAFEDPF